MPRFVMLFVLMVAASATTPAMAYVGPGSGLGAVGVVLGLLGTIILALLSFVWYPIKRMARKVRRQVARVRNGNGR